MIQEDKFHCFIPIEFEKGEKNSKTGEELIKIKGIISTAEEDQQGEFLDPNGFDLTRFVKSGQINWNHSTKESADSIVGHPTFAKVIDGKKVYMEGVLYPTLKKTHDIVNLAKSLEKYGDGRKLGYSIEGKVLERNPLNKNHITKAVITGVAITPTPVNLGTSLELVKGWTNDSLENDFNIQKSANGGETYIIDVLNPETGMRYTVDKDFNIKVEKAMTTQTGSGKPLIKESLEGKIKKLNDIQKSAIITLAKAVELGKIKIKSALK